MSKAIVEPEKLRPELHQRIDRMDAEQLELLRHILLKLEPTYNGQTLSWWLDRLDYHSNFGSASGRRTRKQEEDAQALRAIGTNAIPHLIRQLRSRDLPVKKYALRKIRPWFGGIAVADRRKINLFKTDLDKKQNAVEALKILREQAAPAVPELIRMLDDRDENVARLAAEGLGCIGPAAAEAVPSLIAKIEKRKEYALSAVEGLGLAAHQAVPVVVPLLQDSDVNLRLGALFCLSRLGVTNDVVLRAVASLTNDPSPDVSTLARTVFGRLR
jgi:HEAT repeat protein